MIDPETYIVDDLARAIYEAFPNAYVTSEYEEHPPYFPTVSIIQTDIPSDPTARDSSGIEKRVNITYTVDVYCTGSGAMSDAKALMGIVSDRMFAKNMDRPFCRQLQNKADPSVFRMTARFMGRASNDYFYSR